MKLHGSSPRVRGKLKHSLVIFPERGLIPACAGNTSFTVWTRWNRRAHPRVCGENVLKIVDGNAYAGSSPRVRGKLEAVADVSTEIGLIPACAGKTPTTYLPCA